MGWHVGQGIRPCLTWHQRKLQDLQASTGPEIDVGSILEGEDAKEASKHMYAPRDILILLVDRKDNTHVLEYTKSQSWSWKRRRPKGPNLSGILQYVQDNVLVLM